MRRLALSLALSAVCLAGSARAADDARAVIDKAIQAVGGAEALGEFAATRWKSKGTLILGGNESPFTVDGLSQGVDKLHVAFEGDFGGNKVRGLTVVNGDRGWRKFGDMLQPLDKEGLASEKRNTYLQVVPRILLPLRGEGFTLKPASDQTIGGKPVAVVVVTGPDAKEFTLSFDKETGLLLKLEAEVVGFGGEEYTQETSFADYKEFDGVKLATKVSSLNDGQRFVEQEYLEYKPAGEIDANAFAEPK